MGRKHRRHAVSSNPSLDNVVLPTAAQMGAEVKTEMNRMDADMKLANAVMDESIKNGLAEAVGFNQAFYPQNQGTGWSEQVSNTTSLFKNLRWYLVSNFRQLLNELYCELGLVQVIVDVPVDDALRGGVKITSKQLEDSQIDELKIALDRDDDINTLGQAAKWNRLFGGAGIIVLTDQDPATPLDIDKITSDENLEFRAVDMWELFRDKQNTDGYDPTTQTTNFTHYSYYGQQLHKTRVMRLKGITAPSFIRPRLRGWGLSVVETLVRSLNQYNKATDLVYEVLDEFKLDIYKIKNLVNTLMSPQGEQKVRQRAQIANYQKNYQNAVILDSEDDFDHKQLSFTGIAEAMTGIRMQVASDMRMPLTKIFGISSAGFNSGEDDLEVYNAMVESQVRNKIKYPLLRMLEIKCQHMFGFVPDDLSVSFESLRVMTQVDNENVKTQKFTRLHQAKQAGDITDKEFRDACNAEDLLGIKLDTDDSTLNDLADMAAIDDENPDEITDTDNPGANRSESQKGKATSRGGAPKGPMSKTDQTPKDANEPKEPKKPTDEKLKVSNAIDWDEDAHPRAHDGKFAKAGEGGGGGEVHHGTYEKFSTKDIKPSKSGYFGEGYYVHRDKGQTAQYGDKVHTYKLADKPVFDISGDTLKPTAIKVFKEMGLDVDKITKPTKFKTPIQIAISEIREKFPGEETMGAGAMEKLRSFLKEKGFIGIQFSHNDTDENMVIFDKKDLGIGESGGESDSGASKVAALKKKYPELNTDNKFVSEGTKSEATATAKKLRDTGVHATIWHVDGPASGNKSVYYVIAPDASESDKTENSFLLPKPYTRLENILRRVVNSIKFDIAAYEADGGDAWIDPRRKELFMNPGKVDEALWSKAKEASQKAFGKEKWQFVVYIYKRMGGKFH